MATTGSGCAEPFQLRMVEVAARFAGQNLLGQQALAPKGDESPSVEIAGMEGPETHLRDRDWSESAQMEGGVSHV